jgi:hypothetical protein
MMMRTQKPFDVRVSGRALQCANIRVLRLVVFALSFKTDMKLEGSRQNAYRTTRAYLCLFAAVLFYGPFTALAWTASSMGCCSGDHCPLHHHRQQNTQKGAIDCGHENDEMTACSMDCCHTPEKIALSPLTFVLPHAQRLTHIATLGSSIAILQPNEICPLHEPASPPPRLTSL